jgi:ribose 5-phosphate isomerase B
MQNLRIAIASDHGGFLLKQEMVPFLRSLKEVAHVEDLGPINADRVDYPDFAKLVAETVNSGKANFGIVICGSGIGVSIAANKVNGIRCALCHDHYTAKMARLHNDANVLAFGERCTGIDVAKDMVDTFLSTAFEGGRHCQRLEKIAAMEKAGQSC